MSEKKKILIVDDKSVIAKVVSLHLSDYECIYHIVIDWLGCGVNK